jgi:hypothetical protein
MIHQHNRRYLDIFKQGKQNAVRHLSNLCNKNGEVQVMSKEISSLMSLRNQRQETGYC